MNVSTQQKKILVSNPAFTFLFSLAGFLGEWKRNKKEWKSKLRNQQKLTVYLQELVNTLLDNMYINIS